MPKAKYKKHGATDKYIYWFNTGEYKENGKPKYKALYADTTLEMDKKIEEATLKRNQGVSLNDDKITVAQWAETWLNEYKGGVRDNTYLGYKNIVYKHIIPNIGSCRMKDIRQHHLQELLTNISNAHYGVKFKIDDSGNPVLNDNGEKIVLSKGKKYSLKMIKEIRCVLFSIFDTACANKIVPTNPSQKLKATGEPKKERRALTPKEREQLLSTCEAHQLGLFVLVMFYCGLRKGEALALTANDIKDGFVSVDKQVVYEKEKPRNPKLGPPKTNAGYRKVPMPLCLQSKLEKYCKEFSEDSPLFPGKKFKYKTISETAWAWKDFEKAMLHKEIKDITEKEHITEHILRHNYCTMLYESGIDVLTAAKYMGHDDVKTTLDIYTHLSEQQEAKGIDVIRAWSADSVKNL